MPLESATYAAQLNTSNPQPSDPRSQGDDHLRLVKSVVQTELNANNREWALALRSLTYVTATSFRIGSDKTSIFHGGRRIKAVGGNASPVFGSVTSATFSSSTAVNVDWDHSAMGSGVTQSFVGGPTLKSAPSLPTYAELQSLPINEGFYFVTVRGRRTVGDGGGGHFYWTNENKSTELSTDEVNSGEGDGGIWVAPESDKTGASGAWRRLYDNGTLDILWYGAAGDYDASTETDGETPSNATDNFPAINAARKTLESWGEGRLVIAGREGARDFYASNMPQFQLSNFELYIEKGTTLRITTPSSFGSVIIIGEADTTTNVRVVGGGTVRSYRPNLSALPSWQSDTTYQQGDYVKTTNNHAYYAKVGGTSGDTEPTVISGTEVDGTVTWQDALNENGISLAGDQASCIGMHIPEASNKAISIQTPPWRDCWIVGNVIGNTHHDGIEVKGNQAIAGQENDYGARAWVRDNLVKSAGRVGIQIEQPSAANNKNQDIYVIDNLVVEAGVRHSDKDHAGIRVNRCIRPTIRGNRVLSATGNGVHIRLCEDVRGDVFVKDYGIFGLHLQDNAETHIEAVNVTGTGGGSEAVRENGQTADAWIGHLKVEGSTYTYAYRVTSRGGSVKVRIGAMDITAGSSGVLDGEPPIVPVGAMSASDSGFTVAEDSQSIGSTGRATIINQNGPVEVLGGSVAGPDGTRVEITIDGGTVLQLGDTGNASNDDAGDGQRVFSIPPIVAFDSVLIQANNNTLSAKTIGWSVIYRS